MSAWQSICGARRSQFFCAEDWTGPDDVEAILDERTDRLKALRAVFTKPDGSRIRVVNRYLARTTKTNFERLEPQS